MTRRPTHLAAAVIATLLARPVFSQTTQPDDTVGVFVRDSAVAADKLNLADRMARAQQWDTAAEVYQEVLDGFADRVIAMHSDSAGRPDRYGGVTTVVQDRIAAWPDAGREVYIARNATPAAQMLAGADPNDRVALSKIVDRYFITDAGRDATLRMIELHFEAGEFAACASQVDRLLDHHPSIADADRPLLLLRSTLAWTLAGETKRATHRADELKTKFADARATLGGEDRALAEVAATELAKPRPDHSTAVARSDAWPVPFGSNDHAGVIPEPDAPAAGQPAREWGKLLSFDLEPDPSAATPIPIGESDADLALLRSAIKRQRDSGASTGILPSVDGTQLFFQDNAHVYARDLNTGAAPKGWQETYPASDGIYPVPNATPTPPGAQMTVTLTDRQLVAIVGQSEEPDPFTGNGMQRVPDNGARLICLDRATGKVLWWKRMSDVADAKTAKKSDEQPAGDTVELPKLPPPRVRQPRGAAGRVVLVPNAVPGANNAAAVAAAKDRGDESLRQTEPCGSALVVGDSVYVVSRGGEAGAFDDCYLVSFALEDGAFRWARHLASGNNAGTNFNGYIQPPKHADSHLACADGRIFVSTDMGAIAAVEAADGSLAWLSLYPRPRPMQAQMWFNNALPHARPAFEGNPIIVRDGKVLSLPADGEHLFVHDVSTGQELARLPIKWKFDENYKLIGGAPSTGDKAAAEPLTAGMEENSILVGLAGDNVVVASDQSLSLLDWKLLSAAPANDRPTILSPREALVHRCVIRRPGNEDSAIRGRPFLTDRSIYVPTAWKLMRLTPDASKVLELYPEVNGGDWTDRQDEAPGNVIVAGGNVVVAGPERVSVYAGLGLVRQRLDAAIAAAPDSVAPRLRYAEAMANATHHDEAMKWIDQAAARIATPARAANDPDRAMVFDACARLVRELNRPGRAPDATFQSKLLTRLAEAAGTPRQQVTSRLLRGGYAARDKDYAAAVEAYQQLLDQPAWASIHAKSGEDSVTIAAIIATDESGRAAYASIETRAAAELQSARAAGDPASLLAVADRFPNAAAATAAVRAANDLLTRNVAASPDKASANLAMLRRLADRLTAPADRAALNEAMLRSHLATGDLAAALGRARRVAWLEPGRTIDRLPNVQASTATDIVAELQRAMFAKAEASLPDLKANLDGDSFDPSKSVTVAKVSSLLTPDDLATSRHDRIVAIAQSRALLIFKPGAATPSQTITLPSVTDKAAITWLPGDRLLLRQLSRVACVDVNGQQLAWTFDPATLAGDTDPAASAELANAMIDDADLIDLAPHPPGVAANAAAAAVTSPQEEQLRQMLAQGQDPARAQRQLQRVLQIQANARRNAGAVRANAINVNVNGGGVVIINGVAMQADAINGNADADAPNPPDAKESVVEARTVGDGGSTIILATTFGRVVALDSTNGKVRWTAKPGDRAPATLRVIGNVVVFATTDESSSRVIAFDTATGQEVLRRTYGGGAGSRVYNVAVSDEGWLAVVTAGGVQLFDLFGGEREPLANVTTPAEAGTPPFVGTRLPTQVQFCGDKLLVLADAGGAPASVRSLDMPKLTPTFTVDSGTKQRIERRYLPRFAKDQRVGDEIIELAVHKGRLYLLTGRFMTSFPVLGAPGELAWSPATSDVPRALSLQSPMFVRDGALTIGWPRDFVAQAATSADLQLYDRRAAGEEGESGMCVAQVELTRKGAKLLDKFQPVDGGVYYTTNDGTLIFLPGKKG